MLSPIVDEDQISINKRSIVLDFHLCETGSIKAQHWHTLTPPDSQIVYVACNTEILFVSGGTLGITLFRVLQAIKTHWLLLRFMQDDTGIGNQ